MQTHHIAHTTLQTCSHTIYTTILYILFVVLNRHTCKLRRAKYKPLQKLLVLRVGVYFLKCTQHSVLDSYGNVSLRFPKFKKYV